MLKLPQYLEELEIGYCCGCQDAAILRWAHPGVKRWCAEHGEQAIRDKFGFLADGIINAAKNPPEPEKRPVGRPCVDRSDEVEVAIAALVEQGNRLTIVRLARQLKISTTKLYQMKSALDALREAQKQNPLLAPHTSPYYLRKKTA